MATRCASATFGSESWSRFGLPPHRTCRARFAARIALPSAAGLRASLAAGAFFASLLLLGATVRAHPPQGRQAQLLELTEEDEALLHTPAGFAAPGKPAAASEPSGILEVELRDAATGETVFGRVNVVGSDGNYYEPEDNPLAPFSRARLGNRPRTGPMLYYGWYFYCPGSARLRVPAGDVRVEATRGFEYRPASVHVHVPAGETRHATVWLSRTVNAADWGYACGDTHVHLPRCSEQDDQTALDLAAAEDLRFAFLLATNDPRTYSGLMERQEWRQERGFGQASVVTRGDHTIASGQEYRAATYGHMCLLLHARLVLEGLTVDPNNWPPFGHVAMEARRLGGVSIHAHGGYSREIWIDAVQQATDGVELLQFALYRGIGLEGWYRLLGAGFRFPALGASDYPYCRALGDNRTYALAGAQPTVQSWLKAAVEGRSFVSTGPILLLQVEDQPPGSTIDLAGRGPHRLKAVARARCELAPLELLELIVNGRTAAHLHVAREAGQGCWLELQEELRLDGPAWIAARAAGRTASGLPAADAHTNAVFVHVDGRPPYSQADLDWVLEQVDDQIAEVRARDFPERQAVLDYFYKSRELLLEIRREKSALLEPPHDR